MMHPTIRTTRDTGSSGAVNATLAGTRKTIRIRARDKVRDKVKARGRAGMVAAASAVPTGRTAAVDSAGVQHS